MEIQHAHRNVWVVGFKEIEQSRAHFIGKGSLQNLMMPKLNEWAETSPNPSAKLIQQLTI